MTEAGRDFMPGQFILRRLLPWAVAGALSACGSDPDPGSKIAASKVDSVGGVLNVEAAPFNAVPGVDAYAAIQAAINAACTQSAAPPPVYIPEGIFPLSRPLVAGCGSGSEIVGASRQGTVLRATFNGPAILMEPTTGAITTGPALVGSGNAIVEQAVSNQPRINLRDVPAVELNGLSAFTAEAFFEITAFQTNITRNIVTSQGSLGTSASGLGSGIAFSLALLGAAQPFANLTINGTQLALVGASGVSLNTVHHIALTYDGATIRLFLDGAVVASKSVIGTITQRVFEDVTIGPTGQGLDSPVAFQYPITGSVDSVRLSNVARYAGTFVPSTSKLQTDANTLALENFEVDVPGVTRVWSGNSPYLIPIRSTGSFAITSLHDLTIEGEMGMFGLNITGSSFYDLDCLNCDYGLFNVGLGNSNTFDDISVTAGSSRGRYGIYTAARGNNEFHNVVLDGQRLPFVALGGAADSLTSVTIDPGEHTVFGMIFDQVDPIVNGLTIGSGGNDYQAGLALVGAAYRPVVMNANIAGNAGRVRRAGPPAASGATPTRSVIPLLVDSLASLDPSEAAPIVENTSFESTTGDPAVIYLNSSPAGGASGGDVAIEVSKDSTVPISNDPNLISLASPAEPPPPAAIPAMDPGPVAILSGALGPGVFDVNAYGAVPSTPAAPTTVDSYAAVQAAVKAACAQGTGTVLFSHGSYNLTRPVQVNCNLEMDGASMRWTRLISGSGPALVLNPPGMTGVDPGPPLIGTGHSMKTDGTSYWVDIRNGNEMELDGKGASTDATGFKGFTAEAFVEATSSSSGYAGIVQSAGCLGSPGGTLPGCTAAFQLGAMDGNLYGAMTIGGAPYTLSGPALTLNVVHHVALSYDGVQTIRLFLDGSAVQTTMTATASASLSQQPDEDVTVGPPTDGFYGAAQAPALAGYIDSLRISKTARYTANFAAPKTDLVVDSTTVLLLTFTDNTGGVTASSGGYYFPVVRTAEPDGTPEGKLSVTLKNMGFNYHGFFGVNVVNSKFLTLYNEGDGYTLTGDSSGSVFDNLVSSYGRVLAVNSSNSVFHNMSFLRPPTTLVLHGGDNIQVHALTSTPSGPSPYGMYVVRAGVAITNLSIGDSYEGTLYKGPIVLDHPTAPFRVYKGVIGGAATQGIAAITIDGGLGYVLEGVSFGTTTVDSELIHLNSPLDPGASHMGLGLDYAKTARLSDDPNIQVVGSNAH
jgi:hypothetical protein